MSLRAAAIAMAVMTSATASAQEQGVRLYAAGSLRAVMTELAQAFTASGGPPVDATFGASGLLRERIEKGEPAEVFASADLGNAAALARAGRAAPPVVFARNRLCALAAPNVDVSPDTLLERMLNPRVKVGTSTPKADPSGDYAWLLFEKAEKLRPGAYATLDAKGLKLTGGSDSPPPPPSNRSIYGVFIADGKADIFLTYCTNAIQAVREVPGARMLAIPEALAVGASYGMTVLDHARPAARQFALFVVSVPAQETFARHGFTPVGLP
jgi:ABC-type molybdate transport system substrate-binding protein